MAATGPSISRPSLDYNSTNSENCFLGDLNSNCAESLYLVSLWSRLWFQDPLQSIALLTWRALCSGRPEQCPCSLFPNIPAILRPSLENYSTKSKSSVPDDLNSNHVVSLHSITTEWSVILRVSLKYNYTNPKRSALRDLNNNCTVCSLQLHHWPD